MKGVQWQRLAVQNCWVVYESIDPEAREAEALLRAWEICQRRRGHLTLDLGKGDSSQHTSLC